VLPANAKVKHLKDAVRPKVAELFVTKKVDAECAVPKGEPANIKF